MVLAIELGSSHIKVFDKTRGIVFYEPSVLVVKKKNSKLSLVSFGKMAEEMQNNLEQDEFVVRPIKNGVIVDFKCAKILLNAIFEVIIGNKAKRKATEIVFCIPTCATSSQFDDYIKLLNLCKLNAIKIKPQLTCVASLLDDDLLKPFFIVDIGSGKTEIGLVTPKKVIDAICLSLGGDMIDLSIKEILKTNFSILVSNDEIKKIKENISSLYATDATTVQVIAQNCENNEWGYHIVSSQDIYDSLVMCYDKIIEAIQVFFNSLDDDYKKMILEVGIFFTGLGCEIIGFQKYVQSKLNFNVYLLDTPSTAVVEGALN